MNIKTEIKQTPIYPGYKQFSPKVVNFHGWAMPVQFSNIIEEHLVVRQKVGLFDVSHMGEVESRGQGAPETVRNLVTNNTNKMKVGDVLYAPMCYPNGGIVDDLLVYKLGVEHFLFCLNASNAEKDFQWIKENNLGNCQIENSSDKFAQIAVQGPNAAPLLTNIFPRIIESLAPFKAKTTDFRDAQIIISRTGYTGEDGFEIYLPEEKGLPFWNQVLEIGQKYHIQPIGLGARDTLRMEVKYPLYGNDIWEETNPIEAGLSWAVKTKKDDFIGRDALKKVKKEGPDRKLVCFIPLEKGIPRQGYELFDAQEQSKIGIVTSGTMSPSLKHPIGIGYVKSSLAKEGTVIKVAVRKRMVPCKIIKPPFYKN